MIIVELVDVVCECWFVFFDIFEVGRYIDFGLLGVFSFGMVIVWVLLRLCCFWLCRI